MPLDRQGKAVGLLNVAAAVADATAEHIARKGAGTVASHGKAAFTAQAEAAGLTDSDWPIVKSLAEGLLPQPQLRAHLREILA